MAVRLPRPGRKYEELFGRYYAEPDEIAAHNAESARVFEAFHKDGAIRVPAEWGGIPTLRLLYADETSSFTDYFNVAEEMLRIQATSAALGRRIITCDLPLKPVDEPLAAHLDFHPFSDEAYWGCPVQFFERDQPRIRHLYDVDKLPPEQMPIPDPFRDNFMSTVSRMYEEMTQLVQTDMTITGLRPVPEIGVGGMKGTYGLFNTALQLRGTELFLDMVEDPEYVHGLLDVVSRGYVHRVGAWEAKTGRNSTYSIVYDHGIDMMSMADYERFLVPVYERVKAAFGAERYDAGIEHCGRGEAVIRYKHERFGVNRFLNASFLDLERLRHDLGPGVWMQVTIHPGLVHTGPVEKIRDAVRQTLTPALKGEGRLTFGMQADNFKAPLEHIRALYEAVKEYGRY